jgi:hypothetical protein
MTFKQRVITSLLGLFSLGVPAAFINYQTYSIDPMSVFGGILFASIIGYALGAWRTSVEYNEAEQEEEPCPGCGVATQEAVNHDYDCSEAQQ